MESPSAEAQTNSYDFSLPPKVVEQMKEEAEKTKRMVEISLKYRKKTINPLQANKSVITPALFSKNQAKTHNRSATPDDNPDAIGKALLAKAQEISKLLKSQLQESTVFSQTIKRSKSKANVFHSLASSQLSEQVKVSQALSDQTSVYNNLPGNVVGQTERGRLQKSDLEQFREKKENLARKISTSREKGVPTKQLDANLDFRHVQRKNLLLRVQASLDESKIQKILSLNGEEGSKVPKLNSCKSRSQKGKTFQFLPDEIQRGKSLNEISFPKSKNLLNWDRAGSSNRLEVIQNTHIPERLELDQYEKFRSQNNSSQPLLRAQRSVLSGEECESLPGSVTIFKISDVLKEKKRTLCRSKTGINQHQIGRVVLSQRPIQEKDFETEKSLQDQMNLECSIEMQNNLDRKLTMPLSLQSLDYLDEKPLFKKASRQISFNDKGEGLNQHKLRQNEDFRIKLLSNKKKVMESAPSCPTLSSLTHLQEGSDKTNLDKNRNGNFEFQDKYNKIWNTSIEAGKAPRKGKRKKIIFNATKSIPLETFESINGIVFGVQNLDEGYDLLMK